MSQRNYLGRGLLENCLALPLLFQAGVFGFLMVAGFLDLKPGTEIFGFLPYAGFLTFCGLRGWVLVRKVGPAPGGFSPRYLPILLPLSYTLIFALIGILRPLQDEDAVFQPFISVFAPTHLTSSILVSVLQGFTVPSPWYLLLPPLTIYLSYAVGMVCAFRKLKAPRTSPVAAALTSIIMLTAFGVFARRAIGIRSQVFIAESDSAFAEFLATMDYHPFTEGNRLVKIENPEIRFQADFPRLDGATAVYPIYAAAAQAMYAGTNEKSIREIIDSSTTPIAYKRLISGEKDIIFAAQPSAQQRADATAAEVTLELTPIGKESFVFFVHKENPVSSMTTEQIRRIYTRKITSWSEVGGNNEKIIPFQRPPGSGSQTALEMKVIAGEKLPTPLREEYAEGMGGVIQRVASYRNSHEAIGYSFRFFATTMNKIPDIKLLEIDGVAPTLENIRSGKYPYTVDVFAITAGTKNPNARKLIDWFLSPSGQKLIEDTGYVGLDR